MTDIFQLELPLRQPGDPDSAISDPLKASQKAMGMVPNMYAAMANLPGLLATYSTGYEKFRMEAGFTPQEQEVILLTISRYHECTYCMAAHSMLADTMSKVPADVTEAIRSDREINDSKLEALRKFTWIMVDSRGRPTPEQGRAFLDAGFKETHVLAIVLAIAVKTISNYTNHLFDTEVDAAFAARAWSLPGTD